MQKKHTKKILPVTLGVLILGGIILLAKLLPSHDVAIEKESAPAPANTAGISVLPEQIIQGDPVMISMDSTDTPTSVSLNGKSVSTFSLNGKTAALVGLDLNETPGTSTIEIVFSDGSTVTKQFAVEARKKITAPLGIPEKLGGNTDASVQALVDTLAIENASLLGLPTADHALWSESFDYPIANPVVTDIYGYSRQTGSQTIAHKGTDFRAAEGTTVRAMNRGEVRVAKEYRNYGKTIVIDHGLGVMTSYMHLSNIGVKVGEMVEKGQKIGLSGQTGYAAEPHLHLTIRINDISIDPIVFLGLFNK